MLKIGSLCTGYGGLDMAVEAYYQAETVWVSEFDKHASKVIDARINKPNLGNLKIINWAEVEPIDILTAGYPCQPFSQAGLRKGAQDERHLWPYIKEAISILRPQYVILENVRGHFRLGFREVLSDFASIGYDARWTLIRASEVGAPHRRERLFILAYSNGTRCEGSTGFEWSNGFEQSSNNAEYTNTHSQRLSLVGVAVAKERHQGQSQLIVSKLGEVIPDTNNSGRVRTMSRLQKRYDPRSQMHLQEVPPALDQGRLNVKFVEYMMGLPDGWVSDVDLPRSQKLKILGNGVVPQQAYKALELLHNVK